MNPLNLNPFEQAFWLVIFSVIWVLGFCGLAFIEILDRIANMF